MSHLAREVLRATSYVLREKYSESPFTIHYSLLLALALNEEKKCPWGEMPIPLLLKHKWGALFTIIRYNNL